MKFPDMEQLQDLMGLQPKDKEMFRLLFAPAVTAEEIATFFFNLDIESEPIGFILMLSHLCQKHGWAGVPASVAPRLRGASRYRVVRNAALEASFGKLARAFNEAGIPILLMKGAAMKAVCARSVSRTMGDVDFAVPAEDMDRAVALAKTMGYETTASTSYAMDMRQRRNGKEPLAEGSIDIHNRLYKSSDRRSIHDEIAGGAEKVTAFGAEAWIPAPGNLLFLILENELFDALYKPRGRRHLKWIHDCGMLLSAYPEIRFERLARMAEEYDVYYGIRQILLLLADYLPSLTDGRMLSREFQDKGLPRRGSMEDRIMRYMVYSHHRMVCREAKKPCRELMLWPACALSRYRIKRKSGQVRSFREFVIDYYRVDEPGRAMEMAWNKAKSVLRRRRKSK